MKTVTIIGDPERLPMGLVLGIMLSLLLVLVTGCGQREQSAMTSDADLQKRLLDTWLTEDVEEGEHSKSVVVYRLDGTWAAEATIVGSDRWVSEAGTFLVRGGVLIMTTTNLTNSQKHFAQYSRVHRLPIVRIDDRELVLRDEDCPDQPVTLRRQR